MVCVSEGMINSTKQPELYVNDGSVHILLTGCPVGCTIPLAWKRSTVTMACSGKPWLHSTFPSLKVKCPQRLLYNRGYV